MLLAYAAAGIVALFPVTAYLLFRHRYGQPVPPERHVTGRRPTAGTVADAPARPSDA